MRKNIFVVILLMLGTSTFAQFNFGIKAGYISSLNTSNLNSVVSGNYNLKSVNSELSNGIHAGVFARVGISHLYIQPELLYAMGKKEYKISYQEIANPTNTISYEKLVNISTIDIPILVGYKIVDLKLFNLRAFAGPKLRLNAGSSLDFKNITNSNNSPTLPNLEKDIKAAQLGFEGGVGLDVLKFTLDARYNLIGDIYQTKITNISFDKIPESTFVISLGWKIFP